jgi:isoquinoline 1-oxidoreductase subunit alpha
MTSHLPDGQPGSIVRLARGHQGRAVVPAPKAGRMLVKLTVNGADVEVDDRHAKIPLLWVLRDALGLRGTKFGCGVGHCAACTVLVDGRNTKSCQTPAARAVGKPVTTVEGAFGPVIDAVRDAWYRSNVIQCGYCQPGQTLAAAALLEADRTPDDAATSRWMNGNLRRRGTYPRIREAIHEAADALAADHQPQPLAAHPDPEMRPLTPDELIDPVHPHIRIGDPTAEAVEIARALDWQYPVKVQSLREEEFKSGRYRAMAVHRVNDGREIPHPGRWPCAGADSPETSPSPDGTHLTVDFDGTLAN